MGLIERRQSETDQRKVMISLTEAGAKMQHEAAQIPLRLVQKLNVGTNEGDVAEMLKLKQQLYGLIGLLKNID